MHRSILGLIRECISSPLMYTEYLHAYLIPLDILCSQTMCQPKVVLCAFTIVINNKRGGTDALKEYVLGLLVIV